jgi:hypothetical protein
MFFWRHVKLDVSLVDSVPGFAEMEREFLEPLNRIRPSKEFHVRLAWPGPVHNGLPYHLWRPTLNLTHIMLVRPDGRVRYSRVRRI